MTSDVTTAPGAPLARRVLRAVASVLLYSAAALAAWLLWPTNLGGCTTLTIVSGHSMEPTYETGDLVVSRCGEPQVGDVVVYRPEQLDGGRIIHRLVGGDGTNGWVVQGDNNDWTDPFAPTNDQILGVAQLHVAKVGLVGRLVASPWVFGSCLLIAGALLVWPSSRDEDDTDDADPTPAPASGPDPAADDLPTGTPAVDDDGTRRPALTPAGG
ncbi:signal peptidase I [Cellulomonas sp. H30R-01]|uniref:signal peptidase I n=1 Tax=Cellulomonas sp. H30R-01 TaxID=2704467 RepID=UPI00138B637A|nr:signal peptidase I [Cellulomonas sp. H30R-01]QHT58060.1 signal peptidase I [Cellulomonas sp. H30R-01]